MFICNYLQMKELSKVLPPKTESIVSDAAEQHELRTFVPKAKDTRRAGP
jgi:hypothetical protein